MLCPDEEDEISIAQLANTVADAMHFPKDKLKFDTDKADGQYKKTVRRALSQRGVICAYFGLRDRVFCSVHQEKGWLAVLSTAYFSLILSGDGL